MKKNIRSLVTIKNSKATIKFNFISYKTQPYYLNCCCYTRVQRIFYDSIACFMVYWILRNRIQQNYINIIFPWSFWQHTLNLRTQSNHRCSYLMSTQVYTLQVFFYLCIISYLQLGHRMPQKKINNYVCISEYVNAYCVNVAGNLHFRTIRGEICNNNNEMIHFLRGKSWVTITNG